MKCNIKVGQTIYLLALNTTVARRFPGITEGKVKSIGHKYFTIEQFEGDRFEINTLKHDGREWVSKFQGYLTKEEITDKWERNKLIEAIPIMLRASSLATLRKVSELLQTPTT